MNTSVDTSEKDAIRLAQRGDERAFEYLYWTHARRVYRLCLRMVGNHAEAEDLTQEVFLQVFRKIQTFRGESALSTWLYRMTVNVVLMGKRKRPSLEIPSADRGHPETETGETEREAGAPDPELVGAIDRVTLGAAVAQLAPGYRAIFILHDVEGYKHQEIAEFLNCSPGNSKSQLNRARMKLRRILKPRARICAVSKTLAIQELRGNRNCRLARAY